MKRIFYMLTAVAITACSTNDLDEQRTPETGKRVVVSASIDGSSSRVAMEEIDDPAGNYIKVEWKNEGETFIVSNEANPDATNLFTQTESIEDASSLFEGELPSGEGPYSAIYPHNLTENLSSIYTKQNGTLDESCCAMLGESADGTRFRFKHTMAIIRTSFKVGDEGLPSNSVKRVVLSSTTIKPYLMPAGENNAKVRVVATCDNLEKIYLYVSANISADAVDRSFAIEVETADAKLYKGTLTVPAGKTLQPGYFYTPTIVLEQQTSQQWSSETAATPESDIVGSGTEEDPYKIFRASDLTWLLENAQGEQGSGKVFDIENDFVIESSAEKPWDFCGPDKPFMGTLNGNDHIISGDLIAGAEDALFGFVKVNQGTIDGLGVSATVKGSDATIDLGVLLGADELGFPVNGVGSVVGANMGTVNDCANTGEVISATITDPAEGSLIGTGGLAGVMVTGSITDSENAGNVTGAEITGVDGSLYPMCTTGGIAGGICGGEITECYNSGTITAKGASSQGTSIAGGIVGLTVEFTEATTIKQCTNNGAVQGASDHTSTYSCIGGIAGMCTADEKANTCKIQDCTNKATVTGGNTRPCTDPADQVATYTGGIVGESYMVDIINCTNTAEATIQAGKGTDTGSMVAISVGGIVGTISWSEDNDNDGIIDLENGTTATVISNCENQAAVKGSDCGRGLSVGGLAGDTSNRIAIIDSNNSGNVDGIGSATNIENLFTGGLVGYQHWVLNMHGCSNTGTVNGGKSKEYLYVGGIIGYFDGSYDSCIYDTHNRATAKITSGECAADNMNDGVHDRLFCGRIAGENRGTICGCCTDACIDNTELSYVGKGNPVGASTDCTHQAAE